MPDTLLNLIGDSDTFNEKAVIDGCVDFRSQYNEYRESVRSGKIGKTPQFWIMYLDLMQLQHYIHTAVQENNFDLRLYCWETALTYFFAFNKMNYGRYGSYYVQILKHIDLMFPGLKDLLLKGGIGVQAQVNHPLRTAVDQRGEQTINRDAKTTGTFKFCCFSIAP
jgi:hypothetical protein